VRPLSTQHGGVRVGQRTQFEKSQDHTPSGQVDQRSSHVRQDTPIRPYHGGANPQQTGEQTVRVPGRGQISRVSIYYANKTFFNVFHPFSVFTFENY